MLISPESSPIKKALGLLFTILIIVGAYTLLKYSGDLNNQNSNKVTETQSQSISEENTNNNTTVNSREQKPLPEKLSLTVPFTAQAPTVNWDELHNQACEEVSAIMANAYYNNVTSLPPVIVEKEISSLTEWQQKNFGYNLSISAEETQRMIQANYSLKAELTEINQEKIKQVLTENKLILLPANGQMLNNPNFKTPGPIYHMLVITGYDGDTIITNDPGTKNGLNYKYKYSVLESATGNWEKDKEQVNLNDKKIIIISKSN